MLGDLKNLLACAAFLETARGLLQRLAIAAALDFGGPFSGPRVQTSAGRKPGFASSGRSALCSLVRTGFGNGLSSRDESYHSYSVCHYDNYSCPGFLAETLLARRFLLQSGPIGPNPAPTAPNPAQLHLIPRFHSQQRPARIDGWWSGPRDTRFRRIYVRLRDPIRSAVRPLQRPGVQPRELVRATRPVDGFWNTAPGWLRLQASLPLDRYERRLWERLRHGLPTAVVARVPIWIADVRDGYVIDILLPEFRVGVVFDKQGPGAWDWWGAMRRELESVGIEATRYPVAAVRDDPARVVAGIRRELGIFDK